MSAFEEFIHCFPNLRLNDERFASQKIATGSSKLQRRSFLAFARLNARNGFNKGKVSR